MRAYAAVLRAPHVAALIAATLLARFPIGINALAILLYLRAERGSFAVAGAVAGALAGGIVESASWRTAFLVAGAIAAIGTLVAVARRGTVVRPAAA